MKLNQVFCALVSSGAAVLQEDFESLVDDHETPQVVVASREAFGKQSRMHEVRGIPIDLLKPISRSKPIRELEQAEEIVNQILSLDLKDIKPDFAGDLHGDLKDEGSGEIKEPNLDDLDIQLKQFLNAQLVSGDPLVAENANVSADLGLLVRHGKVDGHDDWFKAEPVEVEEQITEVALDVEHSDDAKEYFVTAVLEDMPKHEKYQSSGSRIINGRNRNNNSSWLGYSLLGSIGAIFVTVSATVCVRRMNSQKAKESGTPIQKLKRYQIQQGQSHGRARNIREVNFSGYNPAFRPQYFNPNQPSSGGFSSAMSQLSSEASSFNLPPQVTQQMMQQKAPPLPAAGPATQSQGPGSRTGGRSRSGGRGRSESQQQSSRRAASHHGGRSRSVHGSRQGSRVGGASLSSGYGSNDNSHNPHGTRALPPPPYAKINY